VLSPLEKRIIDEVIARADRLVQIVGDLVRIRSENTPPTGAEAACQHYCADLLRSRGWEPATYEPSAVPQIEEHPLWWPGRDYRGRFNVAARRSGTGGGRSLVLSGHADTVPAGTLPWTRDPFGGVVVGNRLYGRGSCDMKAGVATNLFIAELFTKLGIHLGGDLTIESVVDEEFGGVNGTLAGRVAGWNADAAVISEPSGLRICPAQRGGLTAHILFRSSGGILDALSAQGVVDQLRIFLDGVPSFAAARKAAAPAHALYGHCTDPVPVAILKISTGPFSMNEPMGNPEECRVELFWQAMPGEAREDVEAQFREWLSGLGLRSEITLPLRWLPGSAIEPEAPIVQDLGAAVRDVLGKQPPVQGIEGPCDMYVFHQFGMPAVLWGAVGANLHGSDEYVDIDSLVHAASAMAVFVARWCAASS
jgi:acetylornithine deacetylase